MKNIIALLLSVSLLLGIPAFAADSALLNSLADILGTDAQPAPDPDQEDAAPAVETSGQTIYPGITNMHMQRGGGDQPTISLNFPLFDRPAVDNEIMTFIKDLARNYEEGIDEVYSDEEETPESFSMWEMSGGYMLERPSPDVVSVMFNIYSYDGGAHGNMLIRCMNFDLKADKSLSLADLVENPREALELFSQISDRDLHRMLGDDADEDMINSGTEPYPENFSNLYLSPWGLLIQFPPYQVAPWSSGPQEVGITLEELAPAIPSKEVWPHPVTPPARWAKNTGLD